MKCIDCDSTNVTGPDPEGFQDCHECGAAWIPGIAVKAKRSRPGTPIPPMPEPYPLAWDRGES